MIIKVMYGSIDGAVRTRVIECVDFYLESKKEDGVGFVEALVYTEKLKEDATPCNLQLGKNFKDVLYVMDQGETVDKIVFYPEPKKARAEVLPKVANYVSAEDIPTEVLLEEILRRSHLEQAPGDEVIIGIGKEHTASIWIRHDAYEALKKRVK